jgi:hypothetical protein
VGVRCLIGTDASNDFGPSTQHIDGISAAAVSLDGGVVVKRSTLNGHRVNLVKYLLMTLKRKLFPTQEYRRTSRPCLIADGD